MRGLMRSDRTAWGLTLILCVVACQKAADRTSTSGVAAQPGASRSADTASASLAQTPNAVPDPCTLITAADAQEILGEEVGEPQRQSLGGNAICDYRGKKLHGGIAPYSVHVAISREQQSVWDAGKKLHDKEMRPAQGVGDDAYFLLDDLVMLSHGYSVDVGVITAVDASNHRKATDDAELAGARKAAARLTGP